MHNTVKNCYFYLNQCHLLCLLASNFSSENPRTQDHTTPIHKRRQ